MSYINKRTKYLLSFIPVFLLMVILFSLQSFAILSQVDGTTKYDQTIYADPSTNFPFNNSVTTIGDKVNIYWKENDWYYIRYPIGNPVTSYKRGYVPVSSISTTATVTANSYSSWFTKLVNTGSQTVYLCPDNSSLTVGQINGTDPLVVMGEDDSYYYIQYFAGVKTKRGYISKSLVKGNTNYITWYAKTSDRENHNVYAYINDSVNDIGTVFGTDPIIVMGEDGNYYFIKYPTSSSVKMGYISKSLITAGNTPVSSLSIVNTPSGNIASEAYSVSVKISDDLITTNVKFITSPDPIEQTDINGCTMGNGIWSYTIDPSKYKNTSGAFMTTVTAYDVNGNITATISLPTINVNTTSIVQYGTSGSGQKLVYYDIKPNKITPNTQKLLAGFEIHGWEDSYAKDGQVLVDIGNSIADYYANNKTDLSNFELIVIPSMNPDGLNLGATNNGPGRCQTSLGIDINRDFDWNFTADSTPRNYTLSIAFSSPESQALRDLVSSINPNIVLDFHGWLDEAIGDSGLNDIVNQKMNLSKYLGTLDTKYNGYFAAWAQIYAQRTLLIEYPPSCANDSKDKDSYFQKTKSALTNMMSIYSVKPTVTGVANNKVYKDSVTITFPDCTAKLNNNTIQNGATISNCGIYNLVVTDAAGISTTINFTIIKLKTNPNNTLTGLIPGMSVSALADAYTQSFLVNQNGSQASIVDKNGSVINSTNTVQTGQKIQVNINGNITYPYDIVLYGDVNGDGSINLSDLVSIRDYLTNSRSMLEPYKSAGDLYGEGDITLNDLVGMMAFVSNTGNINQNQ
jgi:hypothetical protein